MIPVVTHVGYLVFILDKLIEVKPRLYLLTLYIVTIGNCKVAWLTRKAPPAC